MGSGANCLVGPWNHTQTFYLARWITADPRGHNRQIPSIPLCLCEGSTLCPHPAEGHTGKTHQSGNNDTCGSELADELFHYKNTFISLSFRWDPSMNIHPCQKYLKLLDAPLCSLCAALKTHWALSALHQMAANGFPVPIFSSAGSVGFISRKLDNRATRNIRGPWHRKRWEANSLVKTSYVENFWKACMNEKSTPDLCSPLWKSKLMVTSTCTCTSTYTCCFEFKVSDLMCWFWTFLT